MDRHPRKPALGRMGLTALLAGVGVLLAKFTYPLLYGAELVFFGLPVWFALRRLSAGAAMTIAIVSAASGVFLFGLTPLIALFPLEVLVVGLLARWKFRSMIIADLVYWLTIGVWLIGIGYHLLTDGDSPYLAMYLLIVVINAVLAVVIGEFIADYLPVRFAWEAKNARLIHLEDSVFHFTVGLLALPLVIFLGVSGLFQQYDAKLANRAEVLTVSVNEYVNRLYAAGQTPEEDEQAVLTERFETLFHTLSPYSRLDFILTDADNRVIAANLDAGDGERYDWRENGSVKPIRDNFFLWLPDGVPAYNGIAKWAQGYYVSESRLERLPYRLVIRQPAADVQQTVFDLYFTALLSTSVLVMASVPIVAWLGRRFAGMITRISRFAVALPEHLAGDVKPEWTSSRLVELASLQRSISDTSAVLRRMYLERQARETELRRIALKDPLTGLDNRYSFQQYLGSRLAAAKETGEKVACLFLDFDHLKTINDTYGHEAGDAVLIAFGARLQALEASGGNIRSFRLAGDEFIVVAGEPLPDGPENWAEDVCRSLSRHTVAVNGRHIPLQASGGLAVYPKDGDSVDALLRHSDQAMYESKRATRTSGPSIR